MTARFVIKGVRKSYSHALFHACGGCSAPRCLYKVTKISRQLQTARKIFSEIPMLYAGFGEQMIGDKKNFCPGNVKNSAPFSGHSRTYLDIAGQNARSQKFTRFTDLTKWNLFCFFVQRLTVKDAFKEFDLHLILRNSPMNRSQDKQSDRSTFFFSSCRLTAGTGDFLPQSSIHYIYTRTADRTMSHLSDRDARHLERRM